MDATPFLGVLLYVIGGLAGASFYLPFKGVKKWAWESYWMVYALVGLVIVPWGLAFGFSPNVVEVLRQSPPKTLLWCFLFGAMWGVGGLTWGLMIRYLGVGLGLAIGCGLCAAVGTLVPPIFESKLGALLGTSSGIATILGVLVALAGIVVTGMAGMSKERELSEEQKKAGVAEFAFVKGLVIAIFSGVMSAGMFFGLSSGGPIEKLALEVTPVTPALWKGLPVLVVVLAGGCVVNVVWCVILNAKNRTAGDYANGQTPLALNYILSAVAGAMWYSQMMFLKIAENYIGPYKFSGWTLLMSSMIVFSTVWGIVLREWKGSSGRTRRLLSGGLAILIASVVIIGYGNYLEQEGKTPAAKAAVSAER